MYNQLSSWRENGAETENKIRQVERGVSEEDRAGGREQDGVSAIM